MGKLIVILFYLHGPDSLLYFVLSLVFFFICLLKYQGNNSIDLLERGGFLQVAGSVQKISAFASNFVKFGFNPLDLGDVTIIS